MRTYLSSRIILYIFLFLLISIFIDGSLFLLTLSLCILLLYFYRKVSLFRNINPDMSSIFSPVNGKISKITKTENNIIIKIQPSFFGPLGVYMPFSGFVESLEEDGRVVLFNNIRTKTQIDYSSGLFFQTKFWIGSGDLAKLGANIGFLGIGASIKIILNKDSKVLIDKNEKVYAGESIIAGIEVHND